MIALVSDTVIAGTPDAGRWRDSRRERRPGSVPLLNEGSYPG
jgi:hypothetical protein